MTIDINPFIVSGQIPAQYFCDRQKEAKLLHDYLCNQQNVILSAERRMGKTKLVDFVFDKADIDNEYTTIFVDILETGTLNEFVYTFGNTIFRRIASRSEKMMRLFSMTLKSLSASFGYDPIQGTPTFDIKLGDIVQPDYTLSEIFEFINKSDRRCFIVIDEFQQITHYPEKNFEATLRTHIQKTSNANFVFAGSQRRIMDEMFGSKGRPFYNSARLIELNAIPLDMYTEFAQKNFHEAEKDVTTAAIKVVYNMMKGVTLYNQQIMNDAFACTPKHGICDEEMTNLLINRLLKQNDYRFREILQMLSEQQKATLFAIHEDSPASKITSSDFTKKHRLKSPSSTQAALNKLLDIDLVTRQDGCYSLSDPLMNLWLSRRDSL